MSVFREGAAARATVGLVVAAALVAPLLAQSPACNPRPPHAQFAGDNLRRAAAEGDLATAQDYVDRARRQLEQLARGAERCGCSSAQPRFEAAAAELRKAWDVESRRQLRDVIGRVQPLFDGAMSDLRRCAAD